MVCPRVTDYAELHRITQAVDLNNVPGNGIYPIALDTLVRPKDSSGEKPHAKIFACIGVNARSNQRSFQCTVGTRYPSVLQFGAVCLSPEFPYQTISAHYINTCPFKEARTQKDGMQLADARVAAAPVSIDLPRLLNLLKSNHLSYAGGKQGSPLNFVLPVNRRNIANNKGTPTHNCCVGLLHDHLQISKDQ